MKRAIDRLLEGFRPVVVLMDERCISASEEFPAAMRELPGVMLVRRLSGTELSPSRVRYSAGGVGSASGAPTGWAAAGMPRSARRGATNCS